MYTRELWVLEELNRKQQIQDGTEKGMKKEQNYIFSIDNDEVGANRSLNCDIFLENLIEWRIFYLSNQHPPTVFDLVY